MLKLLLEKQSRVSRRNEQYEVEVKDLTEAITVKEKAVGHLGASDLQFAETGRVTYEDSTIHYIGHNSRVWDGKYWVSSPNACHNERVREVLV